MNYTKLLKQNPNLKKLFTIHFLSYFGAWFSSVAIYSMLLDWRASAVLVSIISAIHFLPSFVLAPFVGGIVDSFRAKPLMITLLIGELFMTCGFLFVGSLDDVYLLIILLFVKMSCSAVFFTSQMSFLPKVLHHEALKKANEISSILWSISLAGGMSLGGVCVYYFGTTTAFLLDMFVFSIAIILLFKTTLNHKLEPIQESFLHSIKKGVKYIKDNTIIIHLILLHASVGFLALDALVALLADYHYKYIISVSLAIGLMNGVRAIGIMVGPMFVSPYTNNNTLFYVFILQGVIFILWACIQSNFYLSLVGMFFVGIPTAVLWSYTYSLVQQQTEHKFLGRVLAYNEMIFMLLNVLTSLFVGYALEFIGFFAISVILGLLIIATGFYFRVIAKRL